VIPYPEDVALLTVEQVAAALNICRTAAYEAVKRNEIPSVRIAGRIYVPTAELRRLFGMSLSRPPAGAVTAETGLVSSEDRRHYPAPTIEEAHADDPVVDAGGGPP